MAPAPPISSATSSSSAFRSPANLTAKVRSVVPTAAAEAVAIATKMCHALKVPASPAPANPSATVCSAVTTAAAGSAVSATPNPSATSILANARSTASPVVSANSAAMMVVAMFVVPAPRVSPVRPRTVAGQSAAQLASPTAPPRNAVPIIVAMSAVVAPPRNRHVHNCSASFA